MNTPILGVPGGYRDLVFDEARKRRRIESRLAVLFEEAGYGEIMPSTVEYLDLYRRGKQSVADRAVKFLGRTGELLALRADFTPAIARIIRARLAGAPPPLKIWYAGNVFRASRPHQGGFAEFGQIGAELIGANSMERDVELVTLALRLLESLGCRDVQLHLSNAGIFGGLVSELGLDEEALRHVTVEIDRKDARGLAGRLEDLGVEGSLQDQVRVLSRCVGGPEVLDRARASLRNPRSLAAVSSLSELSERLGPWHDRLTFDLAEIDEMEYYSGVMFSFFSPRLNRELGTGGRYDGFLQKFGLDLPAIGFSLSLDGLLELL